jgi:ABC-type multidrug transport system fused ATPase/permease subunit
MGQQLPVARLREVKRYARAMLRQHKRPLAVTLGLHALAALAGLVVPRLLGDLVERIAQGTTPWTVDEIALAIGGFILVQSGLVRSAAYASARLGEQVLAELREDFVRRVLAIPLSTVERAGSGDLLTRTSRDVDALSHTARFAVPETLIAIVTLLFSVGALLLVSPVLALPCLVAVPLMVGVTRWYLRRAPAGYLRENAAWSDITDGLAETVEGARTIEALRIAKQRERRTHRDIGASYRAERYTLFLRTVFWPITELGYVLPVVATLLVGGWFHLRGWVTLGQVTAATLYVQQLVDPVDRLLSWLDELQVGGASLARLLGVSEVPDDRVATGRSGSPGAAPGAGMSAGVSATDERLSAERVHYAYVPGRDVLHGIDLALRPGERLAMVGPSGAGKSTLGRLLAGIHGPTAGRVTVGGVPLVELPLDELRGHVALVTQEHHVFLGTLRDNVALARPDATDEQVRAALAAVDALDWAGELGLDTEVGTGAHALSPAQAQQLALARLVLADPHTLVLDEATSLLDPRAARHLERSLAAVLHGRTVVAIAHRLFSAHDADRVAVVEDGRITELGSHDELVEAGGAYASLWRSWHGAADSLVAAPAAGPDAPGAAAPEPGGVPEPGGAPEPAREPVEALSGTRSEPVSPR